MTHRRRVLSLLLVNVTFVFMPVLLLQLALPTFMRGRTSPIPGGALPGAMAVLLLTGALFWVALRRARRAMRAQPALMPTRREALLLTAAALLVILLGQSVLSVIAEAIGVVRQTGPVSSVGFTLDYPRYVVITTLAYVWTVSILTLLTVGLAIGYAGTRVAFAPHGWPSRVRLAAAFVAVIGMALLGMKVIQHVGH